MWRLLCPYLLAVLVAPGGAASSGVTGIWREPGGAVIGIEPCGAQLCARLLQTPPNVPTTDVKNPNPALQKRSLCGLLIGQNFHLSDPDHASGGKLYDPKSGKTYTGAMKIDGDELKLRGYVGIKAFGRSETWQRTAPPPPCAR